MKKTTTLNFLGSKCGPSKWAVFRASCFGFILIQSKVWLSGAPLFSPWIHSMAKENLNKTGKKQYQNYHSMKAYNLGDHYQQKLESLLSDLISFFRKLHATVWPQPI